MSSTHLGDLNGTRLDDHVSGVPVPPRFTSQDELDQAAADAVHPDLTNVEAVCGLWRSRRGCRSFLASQRMSGISGLTTSDSLA